MDSMSRARPAVVLFFLLALVPGTRAAQAQSCAGKAAGDVCRPAAGACDVAESCVATGGNPGGAMYQPADGSLVTDIGWFYNMGYAFTPSRTITVTSLGGFPRSAPVGWTARQIPVEFQLETL
jgi:hypothetical protein